MRSMHFTMRSDLPCILIDASYYTFYRFYESRKYMRRYLTEMFDHSTSELHKNPTFLRRVYIDIDNDLAEMARCWTTCVSNIIFCRDCHRRNIWRNEHTSEYKSKRQPKENFNPHMFSILSQYCKDKRIQEMFVEHMEADDLIALTKKKLRDIGFSAPIIIITNDNDYLQLLDENTHAYNMNMENNNLRQRSAGSPDIDLRIKILMGDRSDNIPPVKQHMGPKKAMKLARLADEQLYEYLAKHGCREAFDNNARLIDFNHIRQDMKHAYQEQIHLDLLSPAYPSVY